MRFYIRDKLHNTRAAEELIDDVETAINKRLSVPEAFEVYHSERNRKYPYYRIYVGNYIVYYVVKPGEGTQNIMEVRRLLYSGRNRQELI